MKDTILQERVGNLVVLTLNRPEALNAFDVEMAEALYRTLNVLADDATVRALLLRGNGAYFTAGGDLRWFHALMQEDVETRQSGFNALVNAMHGVTELLVGLRVPVVAAVHGGVAGVGVALVAACDFVVAGEGCVFSTGYAKVGAAADGGTTWLLPRLMGLRRARELIMLSERFEANTALELDLVNRVVPDAEVQTQARQWAERFAAGPTRAYTRVKGLLARSMENSLEHQLRVEQDAFLSGVESSDFAEGVEAFLDRREPKFRGWS